MHKFVEYEDNPLQQSSFYKEMLRNILDFPTVIAVRFVLTLNITLVQTGFVGTA
jgi:hypothetical protein